jgi:glycine/D-amino acid oxidase-like deaminating enzyme
VWSDTLPRQERFVATRDRAQDLPADCDVAIVGAGYTGLWTAWYLLQTDPTLRVVVLEREHVGFGASGRNGGWCSAILPMSLDSIAARHGAPAARRMQVAMHATVDEVGRFCATHAASDVFHKGGTIDVARTSPQVDRIRSEVARYQRHGFDDSDYRWLDAADTAAILRMDGARGAMFTPHCATVHPLRLVHALARAVADAGAVIVEGVNVERIEPHRLRTSAGDVRPDIIVRATEGYTCELPGERRSILPIYSLVVATEPLPTAVWDAIGLSDRPTFADGRHLIIYGQRSADDRLVFGGRGAPYHFGSRIDARFDHHSDVRDRLTAELATLFPAVAGFAVTHHWGGVLGAARDWSCAVRFDRATGLAVAGGYVGDGVGTSNLAGRTLAALITGASGDELAVLPWVGHRSRRWEPEPFRWLGVNVARAAARRADDHEELHDAPSRVWTRAMDALLRR